VRTAGALSNRRGESGARRPHLSRVRLVAAALALVACAHAGHWPPRPAEHPATRAELQSYELTATDPELAGALSEQGFRVVQHPPYKGELEAALTREDAQLVATLTSDGLFVDEAVGSSPAGLAATLARSARVAEFIRNSGLPQQRALPEQ
jgi:hypothetical protein